MNLEINKKNIIGLRITIIGLKRSGYAAALLGHELGANIFVSELNNDLETISNKNKLIKNHGIKIWGQPNLKLNNKYKIKNYLKDHRVMAMSTIAALTLGGKWKIHNPESIKTSFPSFFKILKKELRSKINL